MNFPYPVLPTEDSLKNPMSNLIRNAARVEVDNIFFMARSTEDKQYKGSCITELRMYGVLLYISLTNMLKIMNQVPLSKLRKSIFDLRKQIAEINNESSIHHKKYEVFLWKGLKIMGHTTRTDVVQIWLTGAEDYEPLPDNRYIHMLIRDDLVREKQIITKELINKVKSYSDE